MRYMLYVKDKWTLLTQSIIVVNYTHYSFIEGRYTMLLTNINYLYYNWL